MPDAPIALTCGEPAGIGVELAAPAFDALKDAVPFFLIANPDHLPEGIPFQVIEDPSNALTADALPVLPGPIPGARVPGQPDPVQAEGVIETIAMASRMAMDGSASAVCTLPIHKKALKDGAGFTFPGHTEFLASVAGVEDVVMMLASDTLRVVPATIHIPLKDVPSQLTAKGLETTIRITHDALRRQFGIDAPRIAVAGLNPHAGEGGAMGREDIDLIAPVVEKLQAQGMHVTGPLSADTLFHAPARQRYDAAVCMYHDQALIPIKTLAFDEGVNVTLGLPFIRTSPDHGTAFDIAGTGKANPASTIAALRLAWTMAHGRN